MREKERKGEEEGERGERVKERERKGGSRRERGRRGERERGVAHRNKAHLFVSGPLLLKMQSHKKKNNDLKRQRIYKMTYSMSVIYPRWWPSRIA